MGFPGQHNEFALQHFYRCVAHMVAEAHSLMYTALDRFLYGLCFGMGFVIAANVLNFIAQFLHASGPVLH